MRNWKEWMPGLETSKRLPLMLLILLALLAVASCTTTRREPASHIEMGAVAQHSSVTEDDATDDDGSSRPMSYASADDRKEAEQPTREDVEPAVDSVMTKPSTGSIKPPDPGSVVAAPAKIDRKRFYYGGVDNEDSASAVDDAVWRLLDLADEYHSMGVLANREASWEEAQYYFEKAVNIMSGLDIETDSIPTPEASRYNQLLDNIIADYRVTLRSLGQLQSDVTPSVLVERFGDLEKRLGRDTLLVYGKKEHEVVYDLPVKMNDRVKSSIIYFQTVARDAFKKYLTRSERYKRLYYETFDKHGLPRDLMYLSLVESGFNPKAYSWARASGLWQFIASTGRLYGLKRDWWMDERRDPVKSTDAACRFLKDLYEEFGDWELAMAAYNGGPGRVRSTIKKQKTDDFWNMKLRRQTMDYVPLIYAAAIIAKDPERYGFYDIEPEPEVIWDEVAIDRCLELKVVAREVGCSLDELKELNPELLRNYTPPNDKKYKLKIPKGTSDKFHKAYASMPSPKETSWVKHEIKRGETVSSIAAKYGVSQYAILESNNLNRRARIYAGKTLIVPVPLDGSWSRRKDKEYYAEGSVYTVKSGDTMWDIARAFGTTVNSLRRINYIERGSRIYVGQKLKIPSSASNLKQLSSGSPRSYASSPSSDNGTIVASTSASTHKVRAGDTLWDIARRYGTTTSSLRRLNGMGRSSRIYPGQLLKVSGDGGAEYVEYQVRRGDSLSRIAKQFRTSISKILANNHLEDPDNLRIGQTLRIKVR